MHWRKKGLIFQPSGHADWNISHAALPVVEHLRDDTVRVYYSGRDSLKRAQVGYFDINIAEPTTILAISDQPVLTLGPLGTFDDSGVTTACLVKHLGKSYLYYSGWSLGITVPFYFYIGLAIREEHESVYQRASASPVLGRNFVDSYLTASPSVLIENGVWRMWYVTCTSWVLESERPKHYYHIKYAESEDGIHWKPTGLTAIDFDSPNEYAFGRPCVVRDEDVYRMWYCYRGQSYRIGYAESVDGLIWQRKDAEVGIDVSEFGWDSEMIAYPFVFDHQGTRYMFYNGNGYGRTGIGYAVLEA